MKTNKIKTYAKGMAAAGFILAGAQASLIYAEETETTPAVIEEAGKEEKDLTSEDAVLTEEPEEALENSEDIETDPVDEIEEIPEDTETVIETEDTISEENTETSEAVNSVQAAENSIVFSEDGIVSSYTEGVTIDGTALTITSSGEYTITGTCSEGSITVSKGLQEVILTLEYLSLSSSETAPITIGKNSEVTIINEGASTITDAEDIANEDSSDFEGSAIKVKSGATLTLEGSGTLYIDGSDCKNGIKGASESTIIVDSEDLTLNVFAANNGIACDNEVIINNGIVNVTAGNDGIKSEPDEDDTNSLGAITIYDGIITIDAQGDGIQATGDITIHDGTFVITTYDGHTNIDDLDEDASAKGIKSDANIVISGGDFLIDACEDAIHADGNITITDGIFDIYAGDDAIHADYVLTLGEGEIGPIINIYSAVEGLEGASVIIQDGSYYIMTSDDGINAANSDLSDYPYVIEISGGDIFVDANGDGLDSNGSIYISDGTIIVYGAAQGENSAADYGDNPSDEFVISGGTVLLVGQNQMALTPTSGNYVAFGYNTIINGREMDQNKQMTQDSNVPEMPQNDMPRDKNTPQMPKDSMMPQDGNIPPMQQEMTNYELMTFDSIFENVNKMQMNPSGVQIQAGDVVSIVDENGNVVYSFTAQKSANSVLYAAEDLTDGQYRLEINNSDSSENMPESSDGKPVIIPENNENVIENTSTTPETTEFDSDNKVDQEETNIADDTLEDSLDSDTKKTSKSKKSSSSKNKESSGSSKHSSSSSSKHSSSSSKSVNTAVDLSSVSSLTGMGASILGFGLFSRTRKRKNK